MSSCYNNNQITPAKSSRANRSRTGEFVKKGRHRRYEEARALKHSGDDFDLLFEDNEKQCPECLAFPGEEHKNWCIVEEES